MTLEITLPGAFAPLLTHSLPPLPARDLVALAAALMRDVAGRFGVSPLALGYTVRGLR